MQPEEKRLHTERLLIPEELITEILLCLPVRSLMCFKSVSKSFNSLISDPHFVKLHLRRCSAPNANPPSILCPPCDIDDNISYLHAKSFLKTPPSTIRNELECLRSSNWEGPHLVVGSCNGLLCMLGTHDHDDDILDEQLFWVCLWNPTMRLSSEKWFRFPGDVHSNLNVYCGFGYDRVSDTYKLIFIARNQNVVVFSMGGINSRHVGCLPPDLITFNLDTLANGGNVFGIHLNGTLNWLATPKINENDIEWDNSSCVILSFDLNKEEFVRLLLSAMPHKFDEPHLSVLGECLCFSHNDEQKKFVIWQMKEFGVDRSWTKLFNINYYKDLEPRGLPLPLCSPLYMFDNGDVLMLEDRLVFNHNDNRVSRLEIPINIHAVDTLVICCESLISPY